MSLFHAWVIFIRIIFGMLFSRLLYYVLCLLGFYPIILPYFYCIWQGYLAEIERIEPIITGKKR